MMHLAHQNKNTQFRRKNLGSSKNKKVISLFTFLKRGPIALSAVTTSQDKTRQPSPFTLGSSLYCKAVPWHAQDKVEIRSQLEEENGQALLQTTAMQADKKKETN